ncbi:phosphate-induced protein 1 conserved region-domain-containing protein [Chytridium lagenaria]|nr:phosphate-induced protein 1 conserved region-domain-containing protein [Chytridium lagenaria]
MLKAKVVLIAFVLCICTYTSAAPFDTLELDGPVSFARRIAHSRQRRALIPRQLSQTSRITYHNGTVITGPISVYTIYYGGEWNETDSRIPIIEDFLNNVGQTPWWNTIREYSSKSGFKAGSRYLSVRGRHIDTGSFGYNFTDGFDSQLPLSWPQVINTAITRGNWTIEPNNTIIIVIPASNVSDSTLGGFCTGVCGYHSAFRHPLAPFPSFIPWLIAQSPDECPACRPRRYFFGGSPNSNAVADSIVNLIAHQLAETVTNPLYDGWFFDNGTTTETTIEMSNACEWRFSGVAVNATNENAWNHIVGPRRYLLQDLWSVTNQSCVKTTDDNNSFGLGTSQSLRQGDRLVSRNGEYALKFGANCTVSVQLLLTNVSQPQPFESSLAFEPSTRCLLTLGKDGNAYISDSRFQQLWTTNTTVNGNITAELPSAALWTTNVDCKCTTHLTFFDSLTLSSGGISSRGGGIFSSNGTYILELNSSLGLHVGSLWTSGALFGPGPFIALLRPDASIAIVSSDNHVQGWSGPFTQKKGYNSKGLVGEVTESGRFEVRSTTDKKLLWATGEFGNKLPPRGVVIGDHHVLKSESGCSLVVNVTGNLEVITSRNVQVWSSNSTIDGAVLPFSVGLSDEGLLEVVDMDGKTSFSTNTVASYDDRVCFPVLTISKNSLDIKFASISTGELKGNIWSSPFNGKGTC